MQSASLSPADQHELPQYRDVSRLAILGLILGLLSPVALVHPIWWSVPLSGVVLSAGALFSLSRRNSELTGRTMAVWGLALALFFGGWSMAQVTMRSWVLQSQAAEVANRWIELWKAGELEQVHQLAMSSTERQPAGADLPAFYQSSPELQASIPSFYATPPRSWLKQLAEGKGTIRFIETEFHVRESPTEELFIVLYELTLPNGTDTTKHLVRVHVTRKLWLGLDLVDWHISDCTTPERVSTLN